MQKNRSILLGRKINTRGAMMSQSGISKFDFPHASYFQDEYFVYLLFAGLGIH